MTSDLPLFSQPSEEREILGAALDRAFESVPLGGLVTAESLRDRLSAPARELLQVPTRRNTLGQFFMRLAKSGRVQADGFTEAQRDDARHRALRRWRRVA
jgi:hypothetical protein